MWWVYAVLSAFFAALTAIFAKIGIKNVNTDLAATIRTVGILILAWAIAFFRCGTDSIMSLTKHNMLFLVLSGIAPGLSWIFYFKALQSGKISQVAPIDKLSVALDIIFSIIFPGETLTLKTAVGVVCIIAGTIYYYIIKSVNKIFQKNKHH
ncbi:MAG: EamA family transporter [Chitinophagaceae bacterium]|nr:EamA family transporter [Chitinophagaceae bacterium]